MCKRIIPTYSDDEFDQVQKQLIKEGYSWWDDDTGTITPMKSGIYPIFIVVDPHKKLGSLTWCGIEYVNMFFKKKWRKIKLKRICDVQESL